MIRAVIAGLLLAAALALPATAGKKDTSPKLTQETRDGAQISQENIVKMKLKTVLPTQPNPLLPSLGGPPAPPPPSPPNP